MRALSVTGLGTFEECALRWRFIHIDHFSEAPRGAGSMGKAVHAGIEAMNRCATDQAPPLPQVLQAYHDAWSNDGFPDERSAASARELGETLLRGFHERNAAGPRPLAVERRFHLDWDGVPVQGVIDAILPLPGGGVEIMDYKTTRHPITTETVEASDQLTLYQVAVEREWGLRVERLTLYHVRSQTPVSAPRRGPERVRELRDRLHALKRAVETKRFPPAMGDHCPCEFANRCPYFAPSFQFSMTGDYKRPMGKTLEAVAALPEGNPARLELEAELVAFLRGEGLPRFYGRAHVAELSPEGTLRVTPRSGPGST